MAFTAPTEGVLAFAFGSPFAGQLPVLGLAGAAAVFAEIRSVPIEFYEGLATSMAAVRRDFVFEPWHCGVSLDWDTVGSYTRLCPLVILETPQAQNCLAR